ncbi:MAG: hypothetical protein RMJ82_14835 [Gemmatales bacterium]|nr:hypothetical protein [Gemmatales bacterium]
MNPAPSLLQNDRSGNSPTGDKALAAHPSSEPQAFGERALVVSPDQPISASPRPADTSGPSNGRD